MGLRFDAFRKHQLGNVNQIADVHLGNVHLDQLGESIGKTFHTQSMQNLLQQSASGTSGRLFEARMNRNFRLDRNILADLKKINVARGPFDEIALRLFQKCADFLSVLKLEGHNVEVVLGESLPFRSLHRNCSSCRALAVYDGRNESLGSDSARRRAAFDSAVAHIEHMLGFVCHSFSFR